MRLLLCSIVCWCVSYKSCNSNTKNINPNLTFYSSPRNRKIAIIWKNRINRTQIFKPLSYCFEETIEFDVKASFASCPLSRLIRWYNKPGDITKEFWQKAVQFHGTFHGLKITSWHFALRALCDKHFEESCFTKFVNLGSRLMNSED